MENNKYKILLVDDEPDILEFLGYNLRKEGYAVLTANNGVEALKIAKKEIPHLIVLDVMMPEMDGIETCTLMNEVPELEKSIKVFLTARSEDYSQIAGFNAGADDYISKPVKPRLFLSKVKALLRRSKTAHSQSDSSNMIVLKDLSIDLERYLVIRNNEEILLPKKAFQLLKLLCSKPGKVFTREEILSTIWGNDVVVGDRTIDVHIRKLRDKLSLEKISTIKGVGYKYNG
ncbi:MAG: response regulator transcription factor [Bacteroidales bacterium]|nr:response regulator transcription factor [Bacteroidales bacterium]